MGYALPLLDDPTTRRSPPRPPPAPTAAIAPGRMIDSHGRTIRDLRLSLTDRCNFRCVYCLEPDARFMRRLDLLTDDEIVRVASACIRLGVEKIRLTGGEPTLHPRLTSVIARVAALGVSDLALTTNGSRLAPHELAAWRDAGLTRITVSLDSVRPDRFAAMTRSRNTPEQVIDGLRRAIDAGFAPVKINAVLMRGLNDDEIVPLAALARELSVEMRFIEFMPLDDARGWDRSLVVPAAEVLERIAQEWPLMPEGRDTDSATALNFVFADGAPGRIGLIAPVTRPFCGRCSRLRITADGKVRPCLFSTREWDLRPLLRDGATDAEIDRFLIDATWTKQAGHGIDSTGFRQPDRAMSAIGG